jgi:hypothetical protein
MTAVARFAAEQLEQRMLLASVTWDGGGDGTSWNDARNWSGDVLPGQGDDVVISVPNAATVQYTAAAGDVSINSLVSDDALVLSGGILNVATTIQVNNTFTISGGTLKNATVVPGQLLSPVKAAAMIFAQHPTIVAEQPEVLDGVARPI